jgi:hypothetical protein
MPRSLPSDLERVYVKFLDALATPTAMVCKDHVKNCRWDDLTSMQIDPLAYSDPEIYFRDRAAVDFLRKCKDLDTSHERVTVAESNFVLAEQQCKKANQRLDVHFFENSLDRSDGLIGTPGGACARLIAEARKEMSSLLGRAPKTLPGQFGPGATYGDRGKYTTVPDKMSSRPTLTSSAVYHLFPWCSTLWGKTCAAEGRQIDSVRGNRFTTVPKDCTKDRGIAVEPSINLFYQLSLGKAIRRALMKKGINLTHGQDIHRRVACEASTHGCYATIDLSNASDTVCYNLVKLLLPPDWFELLDSLRSPMTLFKGRWVRLEKFSSMGNGFTFELETAIFLCLILAVRNLRAFHEPLEALVVPGRDIWVYGDDIIVPTDWAADVVSALAYCGFETNRRKSFVTGPFRESCGGDFFWGVDVRPYLLEEFPNAAEDWIGVANGIRRMVHHNGNHNPLRSGLLHAWFVALDCIPVHVRRLRGPEKLGDLVIHDDETRWQTRRRGSLTYIRVYRPAKFRVIGWQNWKSDVALAAILYSAEKRKSWSDQPSSYRGVTPRDSVLGYKTGWVPLVDATSSWLPNPPLVRRISREPPLAISQPVKADSPYSSTHPIWVRHGVRTRVN